MSIGERILKLRKEKNYSQEEIAEQLNVSRQTISKWETGQSTPDFDKIVPLCDLFGITTDELLKGEAKQETPPQEKEEESMRKKTAGIVSISVLLYFIAIIWTVISTEYYGLDDSLSCGIFLLICGFPTSLLIYHFLSQKKTNQPINTKKIKTQKTKLLETINTIIALITTCIYLYISFATNAWDITWIIWIIYAIVIKIIELVIELKGEKDANE